MNYKVHIFAVVRVPIPVEAETQDEAMIEADKIDLHTILDIGVIEYDEEIAGYLVDEIGDEDHEKSTEYNADREKIN